MRFALVYIFGFCAAVPAVAEVFPLGGDVIGPDSSTTDGRGAFRAGRFVPEDVYHGLPGVVFSLSGRERLRSLRAIVTFTARPTGKIQVPNHRFRARLWTLQDYLSQQPPLDDIELGLPDDIEFTTAADGSTVPARTFGQAGGNIPAGVPSYDFRWELSSRAAFDSPLPAGEYVLAL